MFTTHTLGYCDGGSNARNRLSTHLDEYLVFGGIPADEYRILAIFNGQKEQENIALRVPRLLRASATVPDAFMTDVPGITANEKLENEIYQHTGIRGESDQLLYLIVTMIGGFDSLGIIRSRANAPGAAFSTVGSVGHRGQKPFRLLSRALATD